MLQYEVNKAAREQRAVLAEALAGQKEQELLARRAAGKEKAAAAKAAKEAKAAEEAEKAAEAAEAKKQLKAARKERRKANAREKEKERKEQARAKRRVESKKAKRRQAKEASCRKKDWAKAIIVSFLKGHCAFFYYFRRMQLLLNKPDASCEGSLGQAGQSHATEALEENKEVRQQKRLEKSRGLNDLSTGFP